MLHNDLFAAATTFSLQPKEQAHSLVGSLERPAQRPGKLTGAVPCGNCGRPISANSDVSVCRECLLDVSRRLEFLREVWLNEFLGEWCEGAD